MFGVPHLPGRYHAQFPQEVLVPGHQVAGGVQAQDAQFGGEPFVRVQVGQPGRGGARRVGQGQLPGALVPLPAVLAVEFGDVQQQVAAAGAEGVQGAGAGEAFGGGAGRPGAGVQIAERAVRAAGGDPCRLRLGDALHLAQREPYPQHP